MDSDQKKEDCKYWDKCYQRNEAHIQKYNHPKKDVAPKKDETHESCDEPLVDAEKSDEIDKEMDDNSQEKGNSSKEDNNDDKEKADLHKKRKSPETTDNNGHPTKKSNTQRLWQHPDEDYSELLKSNKFIHAKFLVKMPKDFYQFWNFVTSLKGVDLDKFNLQLVGPYDFLAGKFDETEQKSPGDYLRHWRFYYDPPEFQTIFVKKDTGVHYGYWRDEPKDEQGLIIARNDASKGCQFDIIATNAFDALAYFLEKDFKATPFNRNDLSTIRKAVDQFVSEHKIVRVPLHRVKTERSKTIAAKTFHGVGIVVPVDKKSTIGYRPLIESDANLKKIISLLEEEGNSDAVMEKLQPVITASVIALDECDFGSNLELGIDLFCSGHEQLHSTIEQLLVPAYTLLGRPQFLAILKAHLEGRRKGFQLSVLN